MKISVLFSCQHAMLAHALRALLPGTEVPHFDLSECRSPEAQAAVMPWLLDSDLVVTAGVPPEFGPLHDAALAAQVRALRALPSLSFGGFHPDTIHIHTPGGGTLHGPTGQYHSRLVLGAYLAGMMEGEAELLFNRRVFSRLGYLGAFALESELMTRLYASYGIDLSAALPRWRARGVFMHSVNHPKSHVILDLATLFCRHAGLLPDGGWPEGIVVEDNLVNQPDHPVFPPLARELGVEGSVEFHRGGERCAANTLDLRGFIAEEYALFRAQPPEWLRGADRVGDVLALLG